MPGHIKRAIWPSRVMRRLSLIVHWFCTITVVKRCPLEQLFHYPGLQTLWTLSQIFDSTLASNWSMDPRPPSSAGPNSAKIPLAKAHYGFRFFSNVVHLRGASVSHLLRVPTDWNNGENVNRCARSNWVRHSLVCRSGNLSLGICHTANRGTTGLRESR
jgi:hypothetical protein